MNRMESLLRATSESRMPPSARIGERRSGSFEGGKRGRVKSAQSETLVTFPVGEEGASRKRFLNSKCEAFGFNHKEKGKEPGRERKRMSVVLRRKNRSGRR